MGDALSVPFIVSCLRSFPSLEIWSNHPPPLPSPGPQPTLLDLILNLVFPGQTGFFECEYPFIDKLMVITVPAVASARLLGLGSKLYPTKMPHRLNKDLTRFMQNPG